MSSTRGQETLGPDQGPAVAGSEPLCASRLEAENYRTLPRADLLLARARTIINKYIAPGASRAVPLSEPVRERILAGCDSELVGPGLFMEAQMQVCGSSLHTFLLSSN